MGWIVLAVATPLLTVAGYLSGVSWLLPLLQVLPAYPLMVADLRAGRRGRAVARMLLWALLIGATVEVLTLAAPAKGEAAVIHGIAYRDEMIAWVRTGIGTESTPSRFIPQHLLHLAAFVALSLASGSLLSLMLGAGLMNYMSFYVGSLAGIARSPGTVLLYGWPPWAACRVVAFVILGVVLAGPVLRRVARVPFDWKNQRGWLGAAAGGILLDLLLKTLLAGHWSEILRGALFPLSHGF